jgi:hypothetical protein
VHILLLLLEPLLLGQLLPPHPAYGHQILHLIVDRITRILRSDVDGRADLLLFFLLLVVAYLDNILILHNELSFCNRDKGLRDWELLNDGLILLEGNHNLSNWLGVRFLPLLLLFVLRDLDLLVAMGNHGESCTLRLWPYQP